MSAAIKYLVSLCLILLFGIAKADVQIEGSCFEPKSSSSKQALILQYYFDTEQRLFVGGFARYERSKISIPIVLVSKTQTPALFEMRWVEVLDGKISGTYVLTEVESGIRQGRVAYTNYTSGRTTQFSEIDNEQYCVGLRW